MFDKVPKKLLESGIEETYQKGEAIFFQGEVNEFLYLITEGKVEVSTVSKEGQKISIAIYEKGGSLGVLEIVNSEVHTENVYALTKATLIKLHKSHVLHYMKIDFNFNLYIFSLLQECFNEASIFARNLLTLTLKERILLSIYNHQQSNTLKFLNKNMLKREVGGTIRSINRVLEELFKLGIIRYSNKKFHVVDEDTLENLIKK